MYEYDDKAAEWWTFVVRHFGIDETVYYRTLSITLQDLYLLSDSPIRYRGVVS